jgi:hypothetical protein
MKGVLIIAFIAIGFLGFAMHTLSVELQGLANFYSNEDQISNSIVNSQTPNTQIDTQDLKQVIDAYTNIF